MKEIKMKKFLEELINISSISNNELNLAKFLNEKLQRWGFQTLLHKVASTSANLFAWVHPEPPILLSTHLDTVPPFMPAHSDGDTIYGRGACDAKGIITSMIET
ncbi:MAG: M20/M25/M40 family metallo-hydrolase, partial [Calditrichaeota bacterium]